MAPFIGPAEAAHVSDIADLWAAFQREHNGRFVRVVRGTKANRAAMAAHFAQLQAVGQLWSVVDGGAVVGFAAVTADVPKLDVHYVTATLSDLYLRPSHRGAGLGRRLLDVVVAAIAARGLHAVKLSVMAGNPAAALYRRAGFKPFSEILVMPLEPGMVVTGKDYPG